MIDPLERFIVENRLSFDNEEPGREVRKHITGKLTRNPVKLIWWKVAATLFLMSTISLIVDRNLQVVERDEETWTLTQDFLEVETHYMNLIQLKKAELIKSGSDEVASFLAEVDLLDRKYQELKRTYTQVNPDDQLLDVMISNLRLRIELLDQQLRILEDIKGKLNQHEQEFSI